MFKLVETISTLITSINYTHDNDTDTYKDSTHTIYNHPSVITICIQIFHILLFCGYDIVLTCQKIYRCTDFY